MAIRSAILAKDDVLAGFRIDDIIGIGGMAVVYRAEQLSLGRPVALKVLAPQLSDDESFRQRFRREGKNVAALDHPNVVPIYDSGEADGRLFLAMRLIDGTTLADRVRGEGMSADDTVAVLRPIAEALDAAHGIGLVHRDVKPQNILLTDGGHPYLADFGVARGSSATIGLTVTGGFVGSVNYASPEQIRGQHPSSAGDLYALTAVMFECLTGQVPYPRETDAGVMHAHLHEPPPRLLPNSPEAQILGAIIARGLAKNPAERYDTASALLSEAAAAVADLSATQRRAVPAFSRVDRSTDDPLVDYVLDDHDANDLVDVIEATEPSGPAIEFLERFEFDEDLDRGAAPRDGWASGPRGSETQILSAAERRASSRRIQDATTADRRREQARAPRLPATRNRRRPVAAALVTMGAVLAAGAGIILVASTGSSAAPIRLARSGPVTVRYRRPWAPKTAHGPATSSLRAAAVIANGAVSLAAGELVQSAAVPGGVPPGLSHILGRPNASGHARVGGRLATRYMWRSARGQRIDAYVIPTTSADIAFYCIVPARLTVGLDSCMSLVDHATIAGVKFMATGPDLALRVALNQAVAPALSARRQLGGLAAATLPARAAPASVLARSDRAASTALGRIAAPERYQGLVIALAGALHDEAAALDMLVAAARADSPAEWSQASAAVARQGGILVAAARSFAQAALGLVRVSPIAVPATPPPVSTTTTSSVSTAASGTPTPTYTPPPTNVQTPASGGSSTRSSTGIEIGPATPLH